MRVSAEQQLPTDLGTLRKFLDKATQLVDADMFSLVSCSNDGHVLNISAAKELEES